MHTQTLPIPTDLRKWQQEAIQKYEETFPKDFLTTATPGAGKTTFALTLAARLKKYKLIDRIIVVAPTDHLRTQWADNAENFELILDANLKNNSGPVRAGTDGYVTTYAQVAAHALLHRRRTETKRTLVILDEIHHAGDALTWGEAVREAFTPASRRISLTGTPFRTKPEERIPFVEYEDISIGEIASKADYTYGYSHALKDNVVRPVVFAAYTGKSRWKTNAGEVLTASLTDPGSKKNEEAAWKTALNPNGRWIPHVIVSADQRLTDLRESGIPDAGGLMLATDQETARAYAKVLEIVTGHKPVLVLSDDPRSSKKIEAFNKGTDRWLVAVRQVSEGVDIPRLCVLIWTTSYRTPLFFAQAVGRVVRSRKPHESATVFLPAVTPLLALAQEMEQERNHIIRVSSDPKNALDMVHFEKVPTDGEGTGMQEFEALEAEAEFAHLLSSGRAITSNPLLTPEEEDYLGLPGLLTPEQMAILLASRDVEIKKNHAPHTSPNLDPDNRVGTWREINDLRSEIAKMVHRLSRKSNRTHAEIHVDLRKAIPGPPTAEAPITILEKRRDWLIAKL